LEKTVYIRLIRLASIAAFLYLAAASQTVQEAYALLAA